MEKAQSLYDPVFVENPDGSLVQGVPPGYAEKTPPGTPRQHPAENGQALRVDIMRVLARHEAIFLSLLALQLCVEISFETMHVKYREDALFELTLVYPAVGLPRLRLLYWLIFAGEAVYFMAFFVLGVLAAFRSKPRMYQRFAAVALVGTLGQLPLAFLNRFNLLVFFLRFISYAYARFQSNLLQGIGLLREEFIL
mmetsp:Transcript_89110/g.191207  ORF Transcript_89110/g.191207 Transcript_89110/m.191207 type:complete len:196 (-) Transcript_89110:73-660(-)